MNAPRGFSSSSNIIIILVSLLNELKDDLLDSIDGLAFELRDAATGNAFSVDSFRFSLLLFLKVLPL